MTKNTTSSYKLKLRNSISIGEVPFNISRIHNCWNRFGIDYAVWDIFLIHFSSCGQQLKITKLPTWEKNLNSRNTHEKKFATYEISTRKNWDPCNTLDKKFGTHEIPTRKNLKPTKYPRRHDGTMALDPRDPQWHAIHEIWHIHKNTTSNLKPRFCNFVQQILPCFL